MTTTMLTAEQKIEELTKMLREANAEADRLRSKLKESEKKNRKLEAQVANGVTILAGALPLIERLTKESVKIFVSRGIMQGPSGLRHHDANDC